MDHINCEELVMPALAATQRADRLINNLLDATRDEGRQQQKFRGPTDISEVLRRLQDITGGLARYYTAPPVPIHFIFDQFLPVVMIDQEQFERALLNLLDNALAHSPPTGIIEVRAWVNDRELMIEVQDLGPGLPEHVHAALVAPPLTVPITVPYERSYLRDGTIHCHPS